MLDLTGSTAEGMWGREGAQENKAFLVHTTAQCGARLMWVLCLSLRLSNNQIDAGTVQSNYFAVKLPPHFQQRDERENKGMGVMDTLCASCPQTFPSPRGVWAGTCVTSLSKLILTIGSREASTSALQYKRWA